MIWPLMVSQARLGRRAGSARVFVQPEIGSLEPIAIADFSARSIQHLEQQLAAAGSEQILGDGDTAAGGGGSSTAVKRYLQQI